MDGGDGALGDAARALRARYTRFWKSLSRLRIYALVPNQQQKLVLRLEPRPHIVVLNLLGHRRDAFAKHRAAGTRLG